MNKPVIEQLQQAVAKAETKGVTRYRIAQRAGIARSQLSRYLNGERSPGLANAERIAAALGYELTLKRRERQ